MNKTVGADLWLATENEQSCWCLASDKRMKKAVGVGVWLATGE
jgi:hypothetical protein